MIPIIRPDVRFESVEDDLRAVLDSGVLTNGPYLTAFEAELAEAVGVRHAIATTSATTAMHLALVAAGVGAGDEVLVSDFTFPATGNVVAQCGAIPVMVDSAPGVFGISVDDAARRVSRRTRALVVVDPFGQPALDDQLLELAARHRLALVEDAACALGSSRRGVACGSWPGVPGCFSFHPRKVVTTGEGGAITTDDDDLAARLRLLRSHGGAAGPAVGLTFVEHGFNYRLSEIQAVLGLEQLRRLDQILDDRRRTAHAYERALAGVSGVELVTPPPEDRWSYQSFVVMVDRRDSVVVAMRALGVETTLGTYAMHAQPLAKAYGYAPGARPRSWECQQRSLTLPVLPGMTDEQIEQVVGALASCVEGNGRTR